MKTLHVLKRKPEPFQAKAAGQGPVFAFIADALAGDDRAKAFFDSLAPSHRTFH